MRSTSASTPRRRLITLLTAVLLLGVTEAMIGPYLVLFGAERLRLSALEIGVFVSMTSLSGMAVSILLGRLYDRRPGRRPAMLAASLAGTGYLLLLTGPPYPLLLLVAVLFIGPGAAAFPQLFALARSHADETTSGSGARTPVLRSAWSLAWAVGPLAGGALLGGGGYTAVLAATAAGYCLMVVAVLGLGGSRAPVPESAGADGGPAVSVRAAALPVAAFTLFHTAMFSGAVVLPLYVTQGLHGSAGTVGWMFSVCAAAEIPAALALLLPGRWSRRRAVLLGMALMTAYLALLATFTSTVALVLVHLARGVAIAFVGALGISHMQDLFPRAPGRATTLFANTAAAGALVSGIAAGGVSQALGYHAALVCCAVVSAVAWLLFLLAGRQAPVGEQPAKVQEPVAMPLIPAMRRRAAARSRRRPG
ncbi:Sugar efflux transporter A [Nonomuraea coxensis DSM 45129]|uniref:Sugar efflux transporter A n=1 Tax=Nonomuraea coxensis DSM 45129 TaxID=1122611 RepID=A0ABX8UAT3_9ACTN|nr:MFS transporter [Nonomuraea coxensis]QYC43859.1 Sugar efflux transporter A [Nonomuraea coxensis DSM 45129]